MVYASLFPSFSALFPPVNSWTGNLSGNDTIPLDRKLEPGSTPRTVIGGPDSSKVNPSEPRRFLMSAIKDMAEPESSNTRTRAPVGSIAQVYNGVVNIILM